MARGKPKYICIECRTSRKSLWNQYYVPACPSCRLPMLRVSNGFKIPEKQDDKWSNFKKLYQFFKSLYTIEEVNSKMFYWLYDSIDADKFIASYHNHLDDMRKLSNKKYFARRK